MIDYNISKLPRDQFQHAEWLHAEGRENHGVRQREERRKTPNYWGIIVIQWIGMGERGRCVSMVGSFDSKILNG